MLTHISALKYFYRTVFSDHNCLFNPKCIPWPNPCNDFLEVSRGCVQSQNSNQVFQVAKKCEHLLGLRLAAQIQKGKWRAGITFIFKFLLTPTPSNIPWKLHAVTDNV